MLTTFMSSMLAATNRRVTVMPPIGQRIRTLREAQHMTQAALGSQVGVSRGAVSQWESGDTKGLKPENLLKCADALRVSVRMLVTGRDDAPTSAAPIDARVRALPLALRNHLLERLDALEEAARALPFAFTGPIDPSRAADFHAYLDKLTSDLRRKRPKDQTA